MKENYIAPQIEVIEIEIEDAVLADSDQAKTSSYTLETEEATSASPIWK